MAYDPNQSPGGNGASGEAGDSEDESGEQPFYLPAEYVSGKTFKDGDTITLRVLGTDKEGDVKVEFDDGNEQEGEEGPMSADKELQAAFSGPQNSNQ